MRTPQVAKLTKTLVITGFFAAVVSVLTFWTGIAPWVAREEPSARTVVVVVIDTVNHNEVIGVRGNAPFLQTLASESAVFTNAFSTAPWTKPAVASILTGQLPAKHRISHPRSRLNKNVATIAEILKRENFATAGFVSHVFLSPKTDYRRGFDTYEITSFKGHVHDSVTAQQVTDKGLAWIKKQQAVGSQFNFLFLHYFDPHYNYQHHPQYDRTSWYTGGLHSGVKFGELRARFHALTQDDIRFIKGLYREEIQHTDAQLKRLYEGLKTLLPNDELILFVTADHGEAFKEHNHIGHGYKLYNELIRVPLLVHSPNRIISQKISTPVSSMDIAPTILELLNLSRHSQAMQGLSFAPIVASHRGRNSSHRMPIFEVRYHTNRFGVIKWPWKVVFDQDSDAWKAYNLEQDPHELQRVAMKDLPLQVRRTCKDEIQGYLSSLALDSEGRSTGQETITFSPKELETLKTLGYAM